MSSIVPSEACVAIANSFQDFLHHKKGWDEVLDGIEETIDAVCANAYSVGRYSGIQKQEPEPWGVHDRSWRLQIKAY